MYHGSLKETDLVAPVLLGIISHILVRFLSKPCGNRNKGKNDMTCGMSIIKIQLLFISWVFYNSALQSSWEIGLKHSGLFPLSVPKICFSTIIAKHF